MAIETSAYYDITKDEADVIVAEIRETVRDNWRKVAKRHNLSADEIKYMEPAFEFC